MPIVRSYMCGECNHFLEVTLTSTEWDAPPPACPACAGREMRQEFKPPAIGGSARSRAVALAEKIAAEDYHVADMHIEGREGERNKIRYREPPQKVANDAASTWAAVGADMSMAMAAGRESRLKYGNPLDAIKKEPDLIALSKQKSMKIW